MLCLPSRAIYLMANQLGDFCKHAPNFQRCVRCGQDVPAGKAARTHRGDGFPSFPRDAIRCENLLSVGYVQALLRYSIAVFGYIRSIDVDVVTVGVTCVVVH